MQSSAICDTRTVATEGGSERAEDTELSILRDIFRMLPAGVTVQDEQGRFLLVNDAAAAQFGIAAAETAASPSKELDHRRETGIELLRASRPAVAEECVTSGPLKRVFLGV
jgi:cyclic di-GMP phosphodiesterase Gmr